MESLWAVILWNWTSREGIRTPAVMPTERMILATGTDGTSLMMREKPPPERTDLVRDGTVTTRRGER